MRNIIDSGLSPIDFDPHENGESSGDRIVIIPVAQRRREHGPDPCVHIEPATNMDAVTLCGMTYAEDFQKLNTTNLPVSCPACIDIMKFCRSFRCR